MDSDDSESSFKVVNFFEFRRLLAKKIVDGLFIAETYHSEFMKVMTKICKLYSIDLFGLWDFANPYSPVYWLDKNKSYAPYIETNIVDSCNLNCSGCLHFSSLFNDNDFYRLEDFERDIRRIAECVDVVVLRLLGGEPLKAKNLPQYIKIARKYLPKTNLIVVSNGLLIPNAPQELFDTMRENRCVMTVSIYKPTLKILDKIEARLAENNIPFVKEMGLMHGEKHIETFERILSLESDNSSVFSQIPDNCNSKICRFLRDGRLYKCQADILTARLTEKFGIKDFPEPAGIDIHAKNFPLMLDVLENFRVERCNYCRFPGRQETWEVKNKPKLEDFLFDPAEAKRLKVS